MCVDFLPYNVIQQTKTTDSGIESHSIYFLQNNPSRDTPSR